MKDYKNVECGRCGKQWYSPKFDEENEIPDNCPYCYQQEVREIPEPPTKIDIFRKNLKTKINSIPGKIQEKKHGTKIFIENHRMLLSMANVGLIITITIGLLVYFLFIR